LNAGPRKGNRMRWVRDVGRWLIRFIKSCGRVVRRLWLCSFAPGGRKLPLPPLTIGPGRYLQKLRSGFDNTCLCEVVRSLLVLRRELGQDEFTPGKLLSLGAMFKAARTLARIESAFLVRPQELFGYRAWLTRFPGLGPDPDPEQHLGPFVVAVDSTIWEAIQKAGLNTGPVRDRLLAKSLAVVMHEVAHVVLDHVQHDRFSRAAPSVALWYAERRSLDQEFEAWLYSGFLRAFVFAEIGGEKRPDRVPDLV